MAILDVKNLTVAYGEQTIVEDVTFALEEGDFAMIIGPNGSGKTTLLKGLLGLVPLKNGEVKISGHGGHFGCREIGYVPQRFEFDRTFPITIKEFLNLSVWYSKEENIKHSDNKIDEVLTLVAMEKYKNSKLGILSGGQLQRVLIARSLIHGPKLLVLDEPAAGIDITGETNFYNLIKKLQNDIKLTILMVSHDIDTVFSYASQVICINKKLMCFGKPNEVLGHDTFHKLYGKEVVLYPHEKS